MAGSALALAGTAAGAVVARPAGSPAASASVASASLAGAAQLHTLTGAAARDSGLPQSVHALKASEASARQTAIRREIAHQRAVARARKARAAAAAKAAAARRAAQPASTAPASQPAAAQPQGDPQHIAEGLLGSYGWTSSQFSCLQPLWDRESGWSVTAANPSGAYGIPQALPGSKMASAGPDWQTSAATQIRWGLGYIKWTLRLAVRGLVARAGLRLVLKAAAPGARRPWPARTTQWPPRIPAPGAATVTLPGRARSRPAEAKCPGQDGPRVKCDSFHRTEIAGFGQVKAGFPAG